MNGYLMFIILFIIPAILSGTAIGYLLRKRSGNVVVKSDYFYYSSFFAVTYYSVFRLLKILGGRGAQGYFETMAQMDTKAVINTFIRLLLVFVVLAVLTWFWFKDKTINLAKTQLASFFTIFIIFYAVVGKMPSNKIVGIGYIVSVLFAFLLVIVLKKDVSGNLTKSDAFICLKYTAIPVLLWTMLMFVILPNELFFNNVNEITISYILYLGCSLKNCLFAFVCIETAILLFVHGKFMNFTTAGILGIVVAGYVQELIFNGNMFLMAGNTYEWEIARSIITFILWTLIIVIFIFCGVKFSKFSSFIPGISIFILLVRLITVVTFGITTDIPDRKVLTPEGSTTVSTDENIIVFVLDAYDTQIYDMVKEYQDDFYSPLHDFTFYDNLTSKYAFTYMAIPYLLTGEEWQEGVTEKEYQETAFKNSSVLSDIKNQGYSIGIYSDSGAVGTETEKYAINYKDRPEVDLDTKELSRLMMVTSKYVTMPFMFKGHYVYTTDEFLNLSTNESIWDITYDTTFYAMLKNDGLSIEDGNTKGAFRFIHMNGAHAPFRLDENLNQIEPTDNGSFLVGQGIATMKVVYEYLNQLKELGVYDDATIIITADHGQNFSLDGVQYRVADEYGFDYTSSPILFVKNPGENHAEMEVSSNAVTQSEIVETYRRASGAKANDKKTVYEVENGDNEIRYLKVFRYDDIPLKIFEIDGDVHNYDNWKVISE